MYIINDIWLFDNQEANYVIMRLFTHSYVCIITYLLCCHIVFAAEWCASYQCALYGTYVGLPKFGQLLMINPKLMYLVVCHCHILVITLKWMDLITLWPLVTY